MKISNATELNIVQYFKWQMNLTNEPLIMVIILSSRLLGPRIWISCLPVAQQCSEQRSSAQSCLEIFPEQGVQPPLLPWTFLQTENSDKIVHFTGCSIMHRESQWKIIQQSSELPAFVWCILVVQHVIFMCEKMIGLSVNTRIIKR